MKEEGNEGEPDDHGSFDDGFLNFHAHTKIDEE